MNTAFFIAKRYFFAKKKRNFVNLLTFFSMIGVAIGTAALVVVLSVFNGLENLTRQLHTSYNPELKISAKKGKSFELTSDLMHKVKMTEGVEVVTEVIEDNALIQYKQTKLAVHLKGVSDNFAAQYALEDKLVDGRFVLREGSLNYALLGYGVYSMLSVAINDNITPLQFWYPKKGKKTVSPTNLLSSFNQAPIAVGGILFIEQQFDQDHVIVPLDFAKKLTEYDNKRTSLEVKVKDGFSIKKIQQQLQTTLGDGFIVQNAEEQQASILRAFKIERFFAYVAFSFVLALASFNIFFSLAMLAVEKRYDISLLFALGSTKGMIRRIFFIEGALIALVGALVGIVLSVSIVLAQQEWGFVSLGAGNSVVQAYPVALEWMDVLWVCLTVSAITILASFVPARNAARTSVVANLVK